MKAEIISIGTELLLGDIVDTNAAYIAHNLRGVGLDLLYKSTVGDNEQRIASVIDHALERVEVVITSGGLGPTVDDVTREAIARATNCPLEFSQELMDQIAERFRRFGSPMSDNNRRQAMIPHGAIPIENPVGTAPSFVLETERGVVMVLPGVPREMKYLLENALLPWLREYIGAPSLIKTLVLRTAGIGESQIDDKISDLMIAANPTVGLAAHSGQTDIRITAKAATEQEVEQLIAPIEQEILHRVGAWIYGRGKETVEDTILELLRQKDARLTAIEIGTEYTLAKRLNSLGEGSGRLSVRTLTSLDKLPIDWSSSSTLEQLAHSLAEAERNISKADYAMAVLIQPDGDSLPKGTAIAVIGPGATRARSFGWSSERSDVGIWAATHALAMLRRLLVNVPEPPG